MRIPLESEENRVVRPPRQNATGKAPAQIVTTGVIGTTGSQLGTKQKSRASAKGTGVGRVYREVSFNEALIRRGGSRNFYPITRKRCSRAATLASGQATGGKLFGESHCALLGICINTRWRVVRFAKQLPDFRSNGYCWKWQIQILANAGTAKQDTL